MKRVVSILLATVMVSSLFAQQLGIINNENSKHVAFKSINIGECHWTDGFWAERFEVCEETMVPYMGELLTGEVGHALNNFKIAAGLKEGRHKGMKWHDGDFYKYMEAMMYVYAQNGDKELLVTLDEYIAIIAQAQEDDGYLQTYVQINEDVERFGNRQYHEMYNSGHLYTSACIHHRVTGKTNFLDIAKKHADQLYSMFLPETPKALRRFGFNQTQIMGLAELYRETKDKRYLQLAEQFINLRGQSKVEPDAVANYKFIGDMVQERTPLRKETKAEGHAVLALYFYAGAADVYAETGEQALLDALDRLWGDVVNKKMYVTGACGQTHHGASSHVDMIHEGFLQEYMMPNLSAYNETCANICNAMFSYRMLGIHGQGKYADIMELVLFNSALSGISLEGKDYFYANPLRVCEHGYNPGNDTEFDHRIPYVNCFCCPPNLVRTIAKTSAWAYSKTNTGIAVNLYGGNVLETSLLDGSTLKLSQTSNYPWEGKVELRIEKCKKQAFDIALRVPQWAKGIEIKVNEQVVEASIKEGYASLTRQWKKGDKLSYNMPMPVTLVEGNPLIEEVRNQVAVKRGPVVYCVESADIPASASILDIYLDGNKALNAVYKSDLLEGVTAIEAQLEIRKDTNEKEMYSTVKKPAFETVKAQFVPYYAWCNREPGEMTIFVPVMW